MNWKHEESPRVFATREEVRRFARHKKLPQNRILQTLHPVNFAMDEWGNIYSVAPDGSYDAVEEKPLPMWFSTSRRVNEHDT